ncbi:hypothetical protein LEP1GSC073_3910 [Leptospira noguchii str. Cascata]|nr:hypothetical protein LEP1GSC073_3910 [Leptospira noguchii str. Cascata]
MGLSLKWCIAVFSSRSLTRFKVQYFFVLVRLGDFYMSGLDCSQVIEFG